MTGDLDEGRIDRTVGQKIRQYRIARDMSQTQLAKRLGVSFQQVQKMEKGINRIGAGRLWQIASVLNIPVTYFYDGLARLPLDPREQAGLAAASHFLSRRDGQKMAGALYDMNPHVRSALLRLITTLDQYAKP